MSTHMPMNMPYSIPQMPTNQPFFNVMNRVPMAPPLYVGDLDENIHDETLYEFFSKFGPLHFVRIMRDQTSGKSRGFAFVNFIYPRDAEIARQFAQNEKLGRKHIRIMFKRNVRDLPSEANIFVKNLDKNVTVKDLQALFGNIGTVVSTHIATNAEGKSLGYGYVQFEKVEDAGKAIESFQNHKLKENEITLSPYVSKDKRGDTTHRRNIYVKNLPENKSEQELSKLVNELFGKYGEIETFLLKKHNQENKYSAFVCYKTQEAAQKAVEELSKNAPVLPGCTEPLYLNWHQSKSERIRELKSQHQHSQNETNLFVKNLKPEVTDDELKASFLRFGQITSIACKDWTSGDNQKKARMGYINFDNAEDARRALTEGPSVEEIANLFVASKPYIGLHQGKDKRKEYLVSQKKWKSQQANAARWMGAFPMGGMPDVPGRRFPPMNQQMRPQMGRGGRPQGGMWENRGPSQRGGRPFNRNQGGRPYGQVPPHVQKQNQTGKPVGHGQKGPIQTQQPQPTAGPSSGITVQNLRTKLPEFLNLDDNKQRQILGELLFPQVLTIAGNDLAPKITGMLIDLSVLEVTEILEFLETPELLAERVHEAIELIQNEESA